MKSEDLRKFLFELEVEKGRELQVYIPVYNSDEQNEADAEWEEIKSLHIYKQEGASVVYLSRIPARHYTTDDADKAIILPKSPTFRDSEDHDNLL